MFIKAMTGTGGVPVTEQIENREILGSSRGRGDTTSKEKLPSFCFSIDTVSICLCHLEV